MQNGDQPPRNNLYTVSDSDHEPEPEPQSYLSDIPNKWRNTGVHPRIL